MKLSHLFSIGAIILIALSALGCTGEPPPQGFAGVIAGGDSLYVATTQGKLLALDPLARSAEEQFPSFSDGEWYYAITKETRGAFGCRSSQTGSVLYGDPVLSGDHICVATYDGKVLMLNRESRASGLVFPQLRDGEWIYPRTDQSIGPVVGTPTIVGDTVYLCSSLKQGNKTMGVVYALDRVYGDELWMSEPLDGKLWVTPAVVDGTVYISTFDGHVYSLDAASGKLLPWSYQSEFGFVSSPLVHDGMIFVASFDRRLSAIPLGGAAPAWQFQADNWFWADPTIASGIVFASNLDGNVYAMDPKTGNPAWGTPYSAGDAVATSPLVVGDSIVIVTKTGDVHIVNQATGMGARVPNPTNDKATTLNAQVVAEPCYLDGIVYIRAQNNMLYAVEPKLRTVVYSFSLKTE